jgi:hypothetical protein
MHQDNNMQDVSEENQFRKIGRKNRMSTNTNERT